MFKEHSKFKINFVNYPETKRKVSGVYLIEDVYVGASKSIRSRIVGHLNAALRKSHPNNEFGEYLRLKINDNHPIDIFIIDNDVYREGFYIKMMKPKFNRSLTSYPKKNRNSKL